jgi:hypothetical protein
VEGPFVFASALLFRNRGVHFRNAPFLRLSYPQLNLRLYVVDGDGVPSVLFRDMMLPRWVQPAVALAARHPVSTARFDFPEPSLDPGGESWRWVVDQGKRLEVVARRGSGLPGAGPSLGSWDDTVRFFRERPRGYVETGDKLHRIETEHPRVTVWPLTAEVTDGSLLAELLPLAGGAGWPALHSAWLCPEIPFVFDLHLVPRLELETALPTPAASTRSRELVNPSPPYCAATRTPLAALRGLDVGPATPAPSRLATGAREAARNGRRWIHKLCARSMRRPARWPTGRAAL